MGFCWSSVIINLFTILRDIYNDHAKKPKSSVIVLFCFLGTLMTFFVNNLFAKNLSMSAISATNIMDYIPTLSMIVFTICIFKAKSAAQMKVATAIDILFWIVYDFKNFMIVNVIQDLFLILLPFVEYYLASMKKRMEHGLS